jgi:hypothetical protein
MDDILVKWKCIDGVYEANFKNYDLPTVSASSLDNMRRIIKQTCEEAFGKEALVRTTTQINQERS